MDAVKSLGRWTTAPPEQWLRAASRHGPALVTAVLIVAIAYQLAVITSSLLRGTPADGRAPLVAEPLQPTRGVPEPVAQYSALTSAHLFGRAPETPAAQPVVVDAPETTLSLRLTGVVAAGREGDGHAIIASGRNQERFYIRGQSIEGAAGSTLHAVYEDRVILNRGGALETLRLPREPTSGGIASRAPPPPPAPVAQAAPSGSLREVVSANANRFTDVLRIAPHLEGGQMVGFRVNPGRERELFSALGLQPGDVVTDINGVALNDYSQGVQLFESLGEAAIANVTIMRSGAPQVIVIDTSQLEDVAEGLQ